VCSAPLEVLVSILYWGITLIDKRLLVPEEYQLPLWPDFGFHASKLLLKTPMTVFCVRSISPWLFQAVPLAGSWETDQGQEVPVDLPSNPWESPMVL